jgi:hypothetical protein
MFPRNNVVEFDSLTAVSRSRSLAEKYTDPQFIGEESGVRVVLNIQRKGGVIGHQFSGDFDEAVLPRGARYRVVSTRQRTDGTWDVVLYDSGKLNSVEKAFDLKSV